MANKDKSYIFLDSCIFLHYFSQSGYRDITILDDLFEKIRKGELPKIATSTLSITEVAYVFQERDNGNLLPDIEAQMDNFWNDYSIIEMVDYSQHIAKIARQL